MNRRSTSALLPLSLLLFSCGGGNGDNPSCGDGVVDQGEVCDDGNTVAGDGCRADCQGTEVCGDGLADVGEGSCYTNPSSTITLPGQNPQFVISSDFDSDGNEDLVVSNVSSNDVSLFPGNGDGTFDAPISIQADGIAPGASAAGDLNKDGKLDLVISVNAFALGNAHGGVVLLGNGDGTFQPSVVFNNQEPLGPSFINIVDFDGDGEQDLVTGLGTANFNTIDILLGNGDGTFDTAISTAALGFVMRNGVVGDFNGDGKLDIAVGMVNNGNAGQAIVFLGNGDGIKSQLLCH